jgi:energy-coupling factor transporter transmembrane protein EcfT
MRSVLILTMAIYLLVYTVVGINGLWWLVAFFAFPFVVGILLFIVLLSAAIFSSLSAKSGGENLEQHKDLAALIVGRGEILGTYENKPIYEFLDTTCADGITRQFTFAGPFDAESFTDAPADRWIIVDNVLYIFNDPKLVAC